MGRDCPDSVDRDRRASQFQLKVVLNLAVRPDGVRWNQKFIRLMRGLLGSAFPINGAIALCAYEPVECLDTRIPPFDISTGSPHREFQFYDRRITCCYPVRCQLSAASSAWRA